MFLLTRGHLFMLQIEICSHLAIPARNRIQHPAIIFTDPEYELPQTVRDLCPEMIQIKAHDVDVDYQHYKAPTREQIEEGLSFARGKEQLICACHAGISRSSAMAFLCACQAGRMSYAISLLNPALHFPNKLIVRLGSEILGNDQIFRAYENWVETEFKNYRESLKRNFFRW